MSTPVPTDQIEGIVGVTRHPTRHYGRAVSAEGRVYVLHSRWCLDGAPLTECPYSLALDAGIDLDVWPEDVAVRVRIGDDGRLVPAADLAPLTDLAALVDDLEARVTAAEAAENPLPAAVVRQETPTLHNPLAEGCTTRGSAWLQGQRCRTCETPARAADLAAVARATGADEALRAAELAAAEEDRDMLRALAAVPEDAPTSHGGPTVHNLDPRLVTFLRRAGGEWGPMGVALALCEVFPALRESLRIRLNAEAAAAERAALTQTRAATAQAAAAAADPLGDYQDRP